MTVGRAGPQAILFTKKSETPPIWRRVAGAVAGVVACGEVRHTEALLLERFGLSEAALPKVVAVAPDGARSVYEARARPSTPPPFPTVLRPLPRTLRDRPLPLLSFPRPSPSPLPLTPRRARGWQGPNNLERISLFLKSLVVQARPAPPPPKARVPRLPCKEARAPAPDAPAATARGRSREASRSGAGG